MWPANAVQALTAETTEDCRRQPQVNPGGASRVSGVIHIPANLAMAKFGAFLGCFAPSRDAILSVLGLLWTLI